MIFLFAFFISLVVADHPVLEDKYSHICEVNDSVVVHNVPTCSSSVVGYNFVATVYDTTGAGVYKFVHSAVTNDLVVGNWTSANCSNGLIGVEPSPGQFNVLTCTKTWKCTPTSSSFTEKACEDNCIHHTSHILSCRGDPSYCIPNTTNVCVVSGHACYCAEAVVQHTYKPIIDTDNDPLTAPDEEDHVYNTTTAKFVAIYATLQPEDDLHSLKKRMQKRALVDPASLDDPNIFIYFDGEVVRIDITITPLPANVYYIKLKKDGWASFELATQPYLKQIPSQAFLQSGELEMTVYKNGVVAETSFGSIVAKIYCHLDDCLFCWSALDNFACMPTTYKVTFILIWIALGLFILATMPGLVLMICKMLKMCIMPMFWAFKCCWNIRSSKAASAVKKKAGLLSRVTNNYFMKQDQGEEDTERNSIDMKEEERASAERSERYNGTSLPPGRRVPPKIVTLSIICLVTFVSIATACEDGILIPVQTNDCITRETGIEECHIRFDVTATLAVPGSEVCLTIADTDDRDVVLDVKLKWKKMLKRGGLVKRYYTAGHKVVIETVHRCRNAGNCEDSKCEDTDPNDRTQYNELDAVDATRWPGTAYCRRACDCVSCDGCFLCSDSCVFGSVGIVPQGNIAAVYEVGNLRSTPTVELIANDTDGAHADFIANMVGQNFAQNNFSLTVIGNLEGDTSIFDSKFIQYNGNMYFTDACEANAPVKGQIGEIQADLNNDFAAPSVNAFVFAAGLYTIDLGSTSDGITYSAPAINSISSSLVMPININGEQWSQDGLFVQSEPVSPGALVVQLSTVGKYVVTRKMEVVCPAGTFIAGSGCFNCDLGFKLKMTLHSYCRPGTVLMTTDSSAVILWTNAVALNTTSANFTITGFTTSRQNNWNLIIGTAANQLKIPITFTASEDNTIHNTSDIRGTADTQNPKDIAASDAKDTSWFDDLAGWFSGLGASLDNAFTGKGSLLDWLKTIAVIVVGVVVLIVVVPVTIYIFKSLKGVLSRVGPKKQD